MTAWEAIALHTTPEIPRYKQPEVRLLTLGVEYDVLGYVRPNFCDYIRTSRFDS